MSSLVAANAAESGPRRQAGFDDRRQQIVDAARRLFFRLSYEQVSIRDLEQESGFTRGAIYYYFEGKEGVYAAVVLDGLARVNATIEAAAARRFGNPEQQIAEIVRAYARHHEEARPIFDILLRFFFGMRPGYVFPEALLAEANASVRASVSVIAQVVRAGVAAEVFECEDPELQAMVMWGAMSTVLQMTDDNPRMQAVGRPKDKLFRDLEAYVLATLRRRA